MQFTLTMATIQHIFKSLVGKDLSTSSLPFYILLTVFVRVTEQRSRGQPCFEDAHCLRCECLPILFYLRKLALASLLLLPLLTSSLLPTFHLLQLSLVLWKQHLQMPLKDKLINAALTAVNNERTGQDLIDSTLVATVSKSFGNNFLLFSSLLFCISFSSLLISFF
jgi:hypothetical protein